MAQLKGGVYSARIMITLLVMTGILAILGMLASHLQSTASQQQIQAASLWSWRGEKASRMRLMATKIELLVALNKPAAQADLDKLALYEKEIQEIEASARELEAAHSETLKVWSKVSFSHTILVAGCVLAGLAWWMQVMWLWGASLATLGVSLFMLSDVLTQLIKAFKAIL